MLAVLQRVSEARVIVDGETIGEIGPGLLALVCAERGDTPAEADRLLAEDAQAAHLCQRGRKMNRSVQDIEGGLLVVSQFTLAADTSGGNRPSFTNAADPQTGQALYQHFVARACTAHPQVETGRFAADMKVPIHQRWPGHSPAAHPPARNRQRPRFSVGAPPGANAAVGIDAPASDPTADSRLRALRLTPPSAG